MDEQEDQRSSFFDITQYSEKTRKIIFGVVVGLLLAVVAAAMFIISPQNDRAIAEEEIPTNTATQAPVNNETADGTPNGPTSPTEASSYNGSFPTDEKDEAAIAQQKIIEKGLEEQKTLNGKDVTDFHEEIPNAAALQSIATKGMLEYCLDNPKETKEQKQERMKPYFHADNSDYRSPQSIFYLKTCSLGDATEASHDENENIVVHVGVAWSGQYEENGKADTGYVQYRVVVDNNGIVSFDD